MFDRDVRMAEVQSGCVYRGSPGRSPWPDYPPGRVQAGPGGHAALTGELKRRHREHVTELQRALQAAHGKNLVLFFRAVIAASPPLLVNWQE